MLAPVLNATLNLALFRAGPQDFPFHPPLTGVLVPLAVLVNYLVLAVALPPILAAVMSLVIVFGTAFGTRVLLNARNHRERFMQTYHSLLAVNILMTLLLWLPFSEIAPEFERLAQDPEAIEAGEKLDIPGWAALMMNGVNIWNFVVNASIYRHAGGMGFGGGLLVAVLIAFGILMLVLFFASLTAALFQAGA